MKIFIQPADAPRARTYVPQLRSHRNESSEEKKKKRRPNVTKEEKSRLASRCEADFSRDAIRVEIRDKRISEISRWEIECKSDTLTQRGGEREREREKRRRK